MELSCLKRLVKLFYTLNKTLLGESGCMSTFYCLLAAQTVLIPPSSQTQSVTPHLVASNSLCSTCVTYGTLCLAIGHIFGTFLYHS